MLLSHWHHMTNYTAAEWNALPQNQKGKLATKPSKPPIKIKADTPEKAHKSPATAPSLAQTDLDTVLMQIVIRTPLEAAYVTYGPSRIEIDYMGHELAIVPREQVRPDYLRRDNQPVTKEAS
ncbi:hypothetical protein [Nibribacter koreensis]|uniref:Uncharacterized protein n=1 Tax=Nibribacter koreensis TaxID=1084519 RepID=A0ABP8FB59_9BACT